MMADHEDDVHALLNYSGEPTVEQAIIKAREEVDGLENVVLNIAVTGETGSGKSSFVNAIRGLQEPDEGAAETGPTETTMEPTMYPHPTMPNVNVWDLPGIGSPNFKAVSYLKDVNYQNYDFFIIVGASRFKENEIMLANEIKKMEKNFYFVRTRTDFDVDQEKTKGKTEEEILQKIRNYCLENLKPLGPPPVFLISCPQLKRFDYPTLVKKLQSDLPHEKRDALILSLPVYSQQCLEMKYNLSMKQAWKMAALSGCLAIAPVPWVSTTCDVAIIGFFLRNCYYSFGLDDKSLENLSKRVNKPILEEVQKSALVRAIANNSSLATNMSLRLGAAGTVEALCLLLPGFGNLLAAGVSFVTTYSLLLEAVKELNSVAERVIEMAGLK